MLQIASGKLFHQGILKRDLLRGVLHTNLNIFHEGGIATVAGKLLPAGSNGQISNLCFEFEEAIEGDVDAAGIVESYGIDRYQQDFAALASFFLLITCNPDFDLVKRLTSGQAGLATMCAPTRLIRRVFDSQVVLTESEAVAFAQFVRQLLGLKRSAFLAAMRSIRTYVTAIHRMGDDLELAYTLLVASIESLAPKFDGHETTWMDMQESKRISIDDALANTSPEVSSAVRTAILKHEHLLIRRRFKGFAVAHLPTSFFREDTDGVAFPIGEQDLLGALDFAYDTRSKYVHELAELPHELTSDSNFAETLRVDQRTALSFQGLSRVARSVILEFIRRQPVVDAEPYHYQLETGSVIPVRLAASYWMRNPAAVRIDNGREYLEGFMEQWEGCLFDPERKFTNLPAAMEQVELLLPNMKNASRLAYLTVYFGVYLIFHPKLRPKNAQAVVTKYENLFSSPSVESLVVHWMAGQAPGWPINDCIRILDAHLASRGRSSGYHFPNVIDAAISLELVEHIRLSGDNDLASKRLTSACNNFPQFPKLRSFESAQDLSLPVKWRDLLLPPKAVTS